MKIKSLFSIFLLFSVCLAIPEDRQCGQSLENLWLDVVFIVDNSANMVSKEVYNAISSIFPKNAQIGTGYQDPRSSRVAILNYNENVTVVSKFDDFKSRDQLVEKLTKLSVSPDSNNKNAFMDKALLKAQDLLRAEQGFRDNYRKALVVFASEYGYQTSKPANISAQLQDSNITVITVNTGTNAQVNTYFGDIASPGMNLTMNQEDVQMALMKANCHCWSNFHQYTVGNKTYGTCVQIESALEKGVYAATACESIKNGYLTTEFSPEKSDFTMNLFTKAYPKTFVYLNGLQLINGTWYWQRPKNEPLLPLDPSSGNLPTNRSPCGVTIQWSDGTAHWTTISCLKQFHFVCETAACDTENYCESN